jgi:hypothetical protein
MSIGAKSKRVFTLVKRLFIKTWEWARPYFTLKMLPFLVVAWCITNGWSYAFVLVGTRYSITWMTWLGGAWISFLWFPFTAEKVVTAFIAGLLYRLVYKEKFVKREVEE